MSELDHLSLLAFLHPGPRTGTALMRWVTERPAAELLVDRASLCLFLKRCVQKTPFLHGFSDLMPLMRSIVNVGFGSSRPTSLQDLKHILPGCRKVVLLSALMTKLFAGRSTER